MITSTARFAAKHRFLVLLCWVVLLVGAFATSSMWPASTSDDYVIPGSESATAERLMSDHGLEGHTASEAQAVFHSPAGLTSQRAGVDAVLAKIHAAYPHSEVPDTVARGDLSADGTTAAVPIDFRDAHGEALPDDQLTKAGELMASLATTEGDLTVAFSGPMLSAGGGGPSEGIGLLAAVIVLLIAFGSVFAMALPIVVALFGAGCGIAFTLLSGHLVGMPSAATALAGMLAVGVGIDYCLLVVTRYRETLHAGADPHDAIVTAQGTAGRSVVFAGMTVVLAVLGLLAMDMPLINGIAIGAAVAVSMTVLAALTLLPALLAIAGRRIDALALPWSRRTTDGGLYARWSRVIQRRPLLATVASLAALAVLTLPALDLRLGFDDASYRPESDTTRVAYDLTSEKFGAGVNGPLIIAVDATRTDAATRDETLALVRSALEGHDGVHSVTPDIVSDDGKVGLLIAQPTTGPDDVATERLVHDLRSDVLPGALPADASAEGVTAAVTGPTAAAIDYADFIQERLPVFVGIVLAVAFLLLLLVFRSILVPLKAVLANILSIGAAYGVTVAVVQWGWGADLLGFEKAGPVTAWVPMMMFAVVFGLSMDYEVFLLSRVKELVDQGHPNSEAVALGLARTGRVITAAAAIMVCVFGGFVLGTAVDLAVFGLGLAVSVLVDATIVRMVLVPAAMELLGDANWWLPRSLRRLLPTVDLEGSAAEPVR